MTSRPFKLDVSLKLFSVPDTVWTRQAWTLSRRSSFASESTFLKWTFAQSCLSWSHLYSTSARTRPNVSTACRGSSATMTPTSVTLTRLSSPTAPPVWPLATLPTGAAEASESWSPALTKTSLSFIPTGLCGYSLTFPSRMPSGWWTVIYWRATRSFTGLFTRHCHTRGFKNWSFYLSS